MSNEVSTDVKDRYGLPRPAIVGVREVFSGQYWKLPSKSHIRMGRSMSSDIIFPLEKTSLSGIHFECFRTANGLRVRSIGKNPAGRGLSTVHEVEPFPGDWLEADRQYWVQFVSDSMVNELPAVAFSLGIENHYDASMLLHASATREPVLIVGALDPSRQRLALMMHRSRYGRSEGFLCADGDADHAAIEEAVQTCRAITVYVDLTLSRQWGANSLLTAELRKIPAPLVQFIFSAPTEAYANRVRKDITALRSTKLELHIPELGEREGSRRELASLVLEYLCLGDADLGVPATVWDRALDGALLDSLEDLWAAAARTGALFRTGGNVKTAAELLRQKGFEKNNSRSSLDSWMFKAGLTSSMFRSVHRTD
jgi:hypothetical protein